MDKKKTEKQILHLLEKSSFICIFNTLYSTEQLKKKIYWYIFIYLCFYI